MGHRAFQHPAFDHRRRVRHSRKSLDSQGGKGNDSQQARGTGAERFMSRPHMLPFTQACIGWLSVGLITPFRRAAHRRYDARHRAAFFFIGLRQWIAFSFAHSQAWTSRSMRHPTCRPMTWPSSCKAKAYVVAVLISGSLTFLVLRQALPLAFVFQVIVTPFVAASSLMCCKYVSFIAYNFTRRDFPDREIHESAHTCIGRNSLLQQGLTRFRQTCERVRSQLFGSGVDSIPCLPS